MLPLAAQLRLDSLVSQSILTTGAYLAIHLYGTRDGLYEADDQPGGCYRSAAAIERYGAELINYQPDALRQGFALLSIESLMRYTKDIVSFIGESRFEDMTIGGCMERRRDVELIDFNGNVTPKCARRLKSPAAIRRHVKRERQMWHLRELLAAVLSVEPPLVTEDRSGAETVVALYNAETERQRRRQIIDHETWATMHLTPKRIRIERQRRRRIIGRGLPLAISIVGEEAIRSFVRGDEIAIAGTEVVLLARAQSSLGSIGHGGVGITFADLSGKRLARGCIYHDRTPMIDQLTAFALAMRAGEEEELIETANLFHIEPGGTDHPLIAKRVRQAAAQSVHRRHYMGGVEKTVFEAARSKHMSETLSIYEEAVSIFVFGRRAPALNSIGAPAQG